MGTMKFELTFSEAMEAVFNGHAVQGENFAWNCYIISENGLAQLNAFFDCECPYCRSLGSIPLAKDVVGQKYRIVHDISRDGLYHS